MVVMSLTDLPLGDVSTEIGGRLRGERLSQNLTQADLADLAGVTVNTVRAAEHGRTISLDTLVRLMRALGIDSRLDAAFPPPVASPIDVARRSGRVRERARPRRQDKP